MRILVALLSVMFLSQAIAADPPAQTAPAPKTDSSAHRYLIERTFPPGALEGLDAAGKAKINATNSRYGVKWVTSYANASKTKTYCIYEAPDEAAVRKAATANKIPVDSIVEVPVTLSPN